MHAMGGHVSNPKALKTSSATLYNPDDNEAAIIMTWDPDDKHPKKATLISKWSSIKILGVRAIALVYTYNQIVAVMKTNADATKALFIHLDFESGFDDASVALISEIGLTRCHIFAPGETDIIFQA